MTRDVTQERTCKRSLPLSLPILLSLFLAAERAGHVRFISRDKMAEASDGGRKFLPLEGDAGLSSSSTEDDHQDGNDVSLPGVSDLCQTHRRFTEDPLSNGSLLCNRCLGSE